MKPSERIMIEKKECGDCALLRDHTHPITILPTPVTPFEEKKEINKEIHNVCSPCGITANYLTCLKKFGQPPKKFAFDVSAFVMNQVCDICGHTTDTTEPRDFFYPDFTLITKKIKTQ